MLVLSRKSRQRIIIGEGIEITILAISGNRVRLGITAPREVPVRREELHVRTHTAAFSLQPQADVASR